MKLSLPLTLALAAIGTPLRSSYSAIPDYRDQLPRSQTHPQTHPRTHPRTGSPAQPRPQPRNYGARADSLDGIAGHHFGEPLSNFPELEAQGYRDLDGYMYYEARPGQQTGWFGKNSEHVRMNYRFYQDKFASFDASAYGVDRRLLAEQTFYLFGKGQPQSAKDLASGEAAMNWEGQRVRVRLSDGHNATSLFVLSKAAAAQKAADNVAAQKREAAARAAKLRADNAPTSP